MSKFKPYSTTLNGFGFKPSFEKYFMKQHSNKYSYVVSQKWYVSMTCIIPMPVCIQVMNSEVNTKNSSLFKGKDLERFEIALLIFRGRKMMVIWLKTKFSGTKVGWIWSRQGIRH